MANRNSTPHSTRVAIYCRVSTLDQSNDSQLLDLKRYIQERGWHIFKEYCDNGISGTKDSRPALNELMNDAKKRYCQVKPLSATMGGWNHFIEATAFRLKSSVTLSGYTIGSP